ncbi:DUF6415 family natural product biosynthesis protein [Streptomyces antibioticus]|uniref:DUF6415 family natural product biosynthesis protein n=1 Tax=Streptomyces antibioticus TaxID=1890 RepID=UPI0022571C20|nr:DUF6415 family natural product biosynthesis protein [Streptomyces antibioticus]MCX4740838.1 DUF6415 family natural product biosynthesis protein [Streptomyces antibioticus]
MPLAIIPPLTPARVDAQLIRSTCERVIWQVAEAEATEHARTLDVLRGFIGLLLPTVSGRLRELRGEWAQAAGHVIARVEGALAVPEKDQGAEHLHDVAMLCRALLTLHELPAPAPSEA